ncbi:hypothetical protein CNQ84_13625 [Pseudomonas abyssi]|uniref:Uncharacterized protein n=1 Tax=Pseudomonas abyssi TaxID=170540 RepID=A0A2A3MGD1_9PSED|nr:hypothetical protein [Pseudomonas abyssi]PBK03614.1 hypothetical protein CNQ84_13625 [Pseudomonas abyssi]
MASEDTSKEGVTSLADKGLGLLERAWSAHWALRLLCVILFLDIAMMLRTGRGLWEWSPADMALFQDVGFVAILVAAFSLTVAIVIPVVLVLLRYVGAIAMYGLSCIFPFLASTDQPYNRSLGYVPAQTLRNQALREGDDFLFRLYREHEQARAAGQASREQTGKLTAAATLVVLLDWGVAQWLQNKASLVHSTYEVLGSWASSITLALLICVGFIIKWAWFTSAPPDVIYHPSMDYELREDERQKRLTGQVDRIRP